MKKLFSLIVFLIGLTLFAQNRKGEFRLASDSDVHELYVAFQSDFVFDSHNSNDALISLLPDIKEIVTKYGIRFEPGISISADKLDFLSQEARRISKSDAAVQKLKKILKVQLDNPTNERLLEVAAKLEQFSEVEYCALMSLKPIAPPTDIAPTTNNYEVNQTYMGANPGVNMNYAWGLGLSGSGIRVRDVEYGFNPNHEDLNSVNVSIAPGMTINASASTAYTEHGTSVFGIVMADKGTYGISGMAYGAQEMILFPEWQQSGYNRINAITQAIAASQAGDVILYEMQTYGQGSNYVPAEFDQVVWDLTKAATDAGIIIVEAAANGNQNLDSGYYASYMARGNSGAILVGGGRANASHNRISYSTYGSRVDVQGWSEGVFACGYGDAVQVGGDFNQGYTNFSGTSSATPIVASCVIVLQSYYRSLTGNYMTPSEMRQLLRSTGIPQGTGVTGNIGPLPNMQTAIEQLNAVLSIENPSFLTVSMYPNPVNDHLTIVFPDSSSEEGTLELVDALGRIVLRKTNLSSQTHLAVAHLPSGIYFAKISIGNKVATKKILKQ
ncbi:S8/S53 family peptidase [Flavobacterium enshiense]|uniref:S8/S53 family peptidase n=1 Tax=Flavobacterium enshiense TaxID=1341165 RepID=UPI00345DD8CF